MVMETIYQRCCGLDIHKKVVVACLIRPGPRGKPGKEIRSFGTMTPDLLELSDWLGAAGCTHVAMESTGVYWKPIYNILEGNFELLLVNAQHIKTVPGRKTDAKDCEWIAELLQHGLLRGSFVPQQEGRELRELTRYRSSLVRERTAEINRLQKTLEGANIKLASVASEVTGVSGRAMLKELVAGNTDAKVLAQLAKGQLRRKIPQLERALVGQFGSHQSFLVARQLAHIDFLDDAIEQVSQEVAERMGPFEEALERLDTIPGVGSWTAEVIVAEIGTDMSRFPSAGHLASWAGMCPGNNESAGKRKSGKTRKGSKWLRVALTEAAYAAGRGKGTYLSSQYHRLVARRGKKKAAIAVGHTILVIAYHILKDHTTYQDLGPDYFDQRQSTRLTTRLVNRLQGLGYEVSLAPLPQVA
jgi:transposase